MAGSGSTFTSLVPTHYIMMLALAAGRRAGARPGANAQADDLVGAGARRHQARDHGDVPQLRSVRAVRLDRGRLGDDAAPGRTVQPSWARSAANASAPPPIRLLDDDGNEVPDGELGELFSCTPYTFDGYWNMPEKTAEAFRGDYCTVGDMARATNTATSTADRPQEQHDHHRRREHLPVRGRGRDRRPPGGQGRGRDRRARRQVGRARARRRRAARSRARPARPRSDGVVHGRIAGFKRPRAVSFVARRRTCRAPRPARSCTACCATG